MEWDDETETWSCKKCDTKTSYGDRCMSHKCVTMLTPCYASKSQEATPVHHLACRCIHLNHDVAWFVDENLWCCEKCDAVTSNGNKCMPELCVAKAPASTTMNTHNTHTMRIRRLDGDTHEWICETCLYTCGVGVKFNPICTTPKYTHNQHAMRWCIIERDIHGWRCRDCLYTSAVGAPFNPICPAVASSAPPLACDQSPPEYSGHNPLSLAEQMKLKADESFDKPIHAYYEYIKQNVATFAADGFHEYKFMLYNHAADFKHRAITSEIRNEYKPRYRMKLIELCNADGFKTRLDANAFVVMWN